jgi:ADP-heptose:LPS heptosyltransferase
MIDTSALPTHADQILVTRLDGLGDIVLGTMLLSGLHAKWPRAKITLVVRPQMANVGALLPDWVEVVPMPFDPREAIADRQATIIEQLDEMCCRWKPDLAVIAEFNRTWAGEILAGSCGAPRVLAFDGPTGLNFLHRAIRSAMKVREIPDWQTVHADFDDRESNKYIAFLNWLGLDGKSFAPSVSIREQDRTEAAELWHRADVAPENAVVFFPSSSDLLTRSLAAATWGRWLKHVSATRPVVLLANHADAPALDEIEAASSAKFTRVLSPGERIGVMAGFIERAGAVIAVDTGPMHLAAALNRPTLGVFGGGHRAERFLPVGAQTAAIRMPIGCYGCEWHCPFETRLCIREIPEERLMEAGDAFLADMRGNGDVFSPRIFNIAPPDHVPSVLLGPIMRQHRQFLKLNHEVTGHHAYLAEIYAAQSTGLERLASNVENLSRENHQQAEGVSRLQNVISQISAANTERDNSIALVAAAIEEMSRRNDQRDAAIDHMSASLRDMTAQNQARDNAIAMINQTLKDMSSQNISRDEAIAQINKTLAEMSRVNEVRDAAIAIVTERTDPARKKKRWF